VAEARENLPARPYNSLWFFPQEFHYNKDMADKLQLRSFGDYVLIDKIASGGMADVFSARVVGIRGFSKSVAIKRIHAHLAENQHFSAMFTDEAKIASRLSHPNIVQIIELGEVESRPFIAMEFVSGRDLYHVLERLTAIGEPCPWPMAVRIALDLAQALHHAHEFRSPNGQAQSIIHRDVSPRNVLVSFSGEVKLTDFGIARASDREEHTEPGQIKGKVRYMAPEVAAGREIDHRTDIFSLGIVFAELLTMKPYRTGPNDIAILLSIREGRDDKKRFDGLPLDMLYILQRALNRDPDGRYPTAEAFRADLASIATGDLAPMTVLELGHFIGGLFADENAAERRRQAQVDRALERWQKRQSQGSSTAAMSSPSINSASPPTRSGALRETSLAGLLGDLHRNQETGRLDLHRSPLKKSIFFTGGEPVFVISNVEKEAFGEYLVTAGLLTPADLARIRKQSELGNLQLVDLLLRSKAVAPNELYQSLSAQVRDRILDLFTWSDGTFEFYTGERPPEAGMPLNINCLGLIHDGVMEQIPLAFIRKAIGSNRKTLVRRSIFTIPPALSFSGRDQRLMQSLEAQTRSLDDLLHDQSSEERTLRLVYLLSELGFVELQSP